LRKIIDILKKELDPDRIILFGSRAKERFHKNSDFDIAIDKEEVDIRKRREITEEIEKALREGAEEAKDELDKDGVIQRFEFTFELLWKALKIYLAYNGTEVKTPRESLKEAFRINLFDEEEIFLQRFSTQR